MVSYRRVWILLGRKVLPSTSGPETCAGDVNAPVVSVLASERMFSQRLMRLRLRVIGGEIMLK